MVKEITSVMGNINFPAYGNLPAWIIAEAMHHFPKSFVNRHMELVISEKGNVYVPMRECNTKQDIQCRVLEFASRDACKGQPYQRDKMNIVFQDKIGEWLNNYLGTGFSRSDWNVIYQELGNCVNKPLTVKFVESGFDLEVLKWKK